MADSDEHSESEQVKGGNEQEVFWGKTEYYGGSDQEDASEDFNSDAERELREKAEKRKILLQKATKHFVEDDTSSEDEEAEGRGSDEDAEDDENSAAEQDDEDAGCILEAEELKTSLLNDNADGTDSKSSSKLSRKQKEFWLSKLAPELAPLVQEYLEELTYLDEVLLPESQKASSIVNQDESMKQYVELRKGFAQQYVSLLSFYLYKKKTSVEDILTRGGTAAAVGRRTGAVSQTSSDYLQSHPVFEKILELKEVRTEFRDRDDMLLEAIDMGEDEEEQEEVDDMHMNEESISGNPPLQQRVDREADEEEDEDEEDVEMLSTCGESDSDLRGDEQDGERVEVGDVIGNALRNFNAKASGIKASKDTQQLSAKKSTPSPCSDRTDSTSTGQNLSARDRMLQKLAALKNGGKQIVESAGREQVVKGGVMARGTVKHASRNEVSLHKFNSHDDPTLGKMQERKKSALQKYMVEGQKIHNAIAKKQGNSDVLVDFKERKGAGVQRFDDGLPAEFLERQEKEELRKAEEDAAAKEKKALASKKRLQEQAELVDESMLTEGQRQHLELEEDEQRLATKKILQNRGLVRIRPKKDRNSRVKHRRKYEKAVKKRKTVVATMREGTSTGDAYGGETTGIRSTVIKSHKL